ncbi:MAG: hypothetical protein D6741_05175 [Planctomycetota bacterium]|nr:MAG: hypothetical protein D6741_05175 [Planctomycetota bacterium]
MRNPGFFQENRGFGRHLSDCDHPAGKRLCAAHKICIFVKLCRGFADRHQPTKPLVKKRGASSLAKKA